MSKKTTPGLRRLRASPKAESIRTAVLDDQQAGRAEALARIEAEKAEAIDIPNVIGMAAQTPTDAPAPVPAPDAPATAKRPPRAAAAKARPHFQRGVAIEPTPIPTPAERMEGMSRANAALYMAAAAGVMPIPPDFSKPSYASDRGRLLQLVRLAEEGDIESLRAYAIKIYYSAAIELDRFRHRAILALEAQAAAA